ncbi:alpha/beta fold hydrolase [Microvirga massiliensis]|uniref:alpha/beta fold hydrolase n=1 Tax=Microvirga massiliensis TaxID=1033741 RepID=UPI00062BC1E2|nr:alpha/beta hydrolase [Microvirga massiliensis]
MRLYARDYGPILSGTTPVICLPGLSRNSVDFHALALKLAHHPDHPRRVLALDYRGRGRSQYDNDWRRYDVRVETNDVLQMLAAAGIERASFVGTSRGGLIIMGLAAMRPGLIEKVVLNDIGPVIDPKGLIRIKGYVGRLPVPRDFREAGRILKQISGTQFPRLPSEKWEEMARGTWREEKGRLVLDYDPRLLKTLELLDLEQPLPALWGLFEGLKPIPVLALRGANSDLLGAETLAAMAEFHPKLKAITVPDEGHAPFLDGALAQHIVGFLDLP